MLSSASVHGYVLTSVSYLQWLWKWK